jgi:preprotein translocase subunit SecF
VIYDRIRELADVPGNRGVPLAKIINKATNEMLGRTILTSTTTWMSSLALFLIAGGAIEDFALAMLVGVIAGVYSTIYVASPLIILFRDVIDKKKAASAA